MAQFWPTNWPNQSILFFFSLLLPLSQSQLCPCSSLYSTSGDNSTTPRPLLSAHLNFFLTQKLYLSFPPSLSLSLSLSCLSFLLADHGGYGDRWQCKPQGHTSRSTKFRKARTSGPQPFSYPIIAVAGGGPRVGGHEGTTQDLRPLASFNGQNRCQQVPLGLFVIMVPSVCDKSVRIGGTFFHIKR